MLQEASSLLGLLFASPIVAEPLAFMACLFLPYAMLVWRALHGRRLVILWFAALGLVAPAAVYVGTSVASGLPVTELPLYAVACGGILGGLVGQVWASVSSSEAGRDVAKNHIEEIGA
jgi:hypothetical protein